MQRNFMKCQDGSRVPGSAAIIHYRRKTRRDPVQPDTDNVMSGELIAVQQDSKVRNSVPIRASDHSMRKNPRSIEVVNEQFHP